MSYYESACKLKYILESHSEFRNFVFVYDDFESLKSEKQLELMTSFLSFYECIRNTRARVNLKYFVCLRTSTYYTISLKESYDKTRTDTPQIVNNVPAILELFEKRFNIIDDEFNVFKNVVKKDEWIRAKEVLLQVASRIDYVAGPLLFELNNFNVSQALDSFSKILSNRQWTQHNKNMTASFIIEGEDYYVNSLNIYRVLFLGENDVFFNNSLQYFNSIFKNGGWIKEDFIYLYTIHFFYRRYISFSSGNNFADLAYSIDSLCESLCFLFSNEETRDITKRTFETAIDYFKASRFLKKYDFIPEAKEENDDHYLTPRGRAIYCGFTETSILFEIFRDAFSLDAKVFDVRCSNEMQKEELFIEYKKYLSIFWDYEKQQLVSINNTPAKRERFISLFGGRALSRLLIEGLKRSLSMYYKVGMSDYGKKICKTLNKMLVEVGEIEQSLDY